MASESIAHSADSEPIRARGIIVKSKVTNNLSLKKHEMCPANVAGIATMDAPVSY